MKKLIIKSVLFILPLILFVYLFFRIEPVQETYVASILDKHARLDSTAGEKQRIILVGGSNIAMGLDSEYLEKTLGISAVNTGIHAGIGIKMCMDDVKPYIKEGDIVVLIPEYEHFFDDYAYGNLQMVEMLDFSPVNIRYLNIGQINTLLSHIPDYSLMKLKMLTGSYRANELYNRNVFNEYGDAVAHLNLDRDGALPANNLLSDESRMNQKVFEYMNDFGIDVDNAGGSLVLSYPSIAKVQADLITYRNCMLKVKDNIQGKFRYPIISKQSDYILNNSHFYDSCYHLNAIGVKIRSEKLASDIENYLNHDEVFVSK